LPPAKQFEWNIFMDRPLTVQKGNRTNCLLPPTSIMIWSKLHREMVDAIKRGLMESIASGSANGLRNNFL